MKIVYLIGNGFDLNLGMKTKCSDFCEYYVKLPIGDDDNAIQQLKDKLKEHKKDWSDLESFLGKYLKGIDKESATTIHEDLIGHLSKYIMDEEGKYIIPDGQKKKFFEYLSQPSLNRLSDKGMKEINEYISTRENKNEILDIKIITFNYTKSIEKILGLKNDINKPIEAKIHNMKLCVDIRHIHGFTDKWLIFGVNDVSQMENESLRNIDEVVDRYVKADCIRTYISELTSDYDEECQQWIKGADLICLFGLSFGKSDARWWNSVSNRLIENCKSIIFQYEPRDLSDIRGPAKAALRKTVKNKFLFEVSVEEKLKENIKENIYVALNTDMFKFKRLELQSKIQKRRKNIARVSVVIEIALTLVLALILIPNYTKNNSSKPKGKDEVQLAITVNDTMPSKSTSRDTTSTNDTMPSKSTSRDTTSTAVALASTPPRHQSTQRPQHNDLFDVSASVDLEESYKQARLNEDTNQSLAIMAYNANIKKFPKDPRNYVRLGVIYSQKNETLDQAAANLNSAVRLVDNNADIWLLLAQVNGKLKRTDAELAAYKKYSSLNSKDLTVSRRIGEINYEKKLWTEAITNLEIFLTTNDKDVKVLLMLVDAYEATNRQAKATELLAKAKDLNDRDPGVRERLYTMYKKGGLKAKAEAEIRDLVSITRNNKHRLMLCNELIEAQKYDEAASVVAEVRMNDPLNFEGLMVTATIQKLQKKYVESIETYKSVLYLNDRYAPAYSGRADAHFAMNEFDKAEGFYKRALELDPKLASAALGLAKVYKAQNKRDLYNTYLDLAKRLDPNSKALQDELKQP
jgi:tetratricopeptide (TPR) repeat protein